MQKTFNPFKLIGSWLGLLVGIYATYRETNPFSFLDPIFNFIDGSNLELNIIGCFFVGYALHLLLRSMLANSMKKTKNYTDKKV